ncbi:Skp1 domain-containing protein [Heracleum sosnowskyi]|uniref:Skp1 domain-containing protein n=1 Tax=Heracleum sosnowskyi TaxID=360622 RepID=A0AAD8I216_9APIA|nr:Skp1 domain-containing protein [Heracleum sosnowskyi]
MPHLTMKSYIWIQTSDGTVQEVEQGIAMLCPYIAHEMSAGLGSSKTNPISLSSRVKPNSLSLIFDYCRFHGLPGRSNKERKTFDENFLRKDTSSLCELVNAAHYLQLRPLYEKTCSAIARKIEDESPEEIRRLFNFPDDLTEAEKLEPWKNAPDDSRIRLLNRLYAKKKKELEEVENVKKVEAEVEVQEHKDDRSVDDLVSFINGGHGDNKGVRTSKKKKKIRNRREEQKNAPSGCGSSNEASHSKDVLENHDKDSNASEASYHSVQSTGDLSSPLHDTLNLPNLRDDSFNFEDEFDDDDDIDPVLKERIDREVEDFARIINLSLPDRKQEIYSSFENRLAIEGNGSRTEDGN